MTSIPGVASPVPAQEQNATTLLLRSLLRLRASIGSILLGATLLFTFGAGWDITSHRTVGRDATFSPAHVTMLTALTIMGLAAMVLVLIETRWARRNPGVRDYGITFAGGFSGPLGAYLTGFGAIAAAIAFPLDNYWHSLYGIDVSLWAPFHVMIIMGTVLSSIGVTSLLISTAHLAASQHARKLKSLCTIAAMIALADVAGKLISIVNPALSAQGMIGSFNLYPIMISLSAMIGIIAAVFAFPSRWAATIMTLIRIVINIILGIVIPPVMVWQINFEHETLLPRAIQAAGQGSTRSTLLTAVLFLALALIVDGIVWYARKKGWTPRAFLSGLYIAALPALLVVAIVGLAAFRGQGLAATSRLANLSSLGLATILISLILIPVGELAGLWLGQAMGQSLQVEADQ